MLILGLIDLSASFILLSRIFGVRVPIEAMILIPLGLLFKWLVSVTDIGGITDLIVAILIILSIFLNLPWWLLLIPACLILIKGILSLIRL
ncbi:MAG: hypothetical protein AAB565_00655 [Patescibacteria group bacterium]